MQTPARKVFQLVAAMLVVQILGTAAYLTPSVIILEAASDFGVEPGLIGTFIALVFGSAALSTSASGRMVAMLGPTRVVQLCLALQAVGVLLLLPAEPLLAVVSAVLIGLGYGPTTPASSHLLVRHTPAARRSLLFSIRQTGVPLAGVLLGLSVPALTVLHGWQSSLALVAALCLSLSLWLGFQRRELDTPAADVGPLAPAQIRGFVALMRATYADVRLRGMVAISFLFAVVQLSFAGFMVLTLRRGAEISLVDAGLVLAVSNAAGIFGRIFWGWLADRIGKAAPVLIGLGVVMALACLGFSLLRPSLPLGLLFFLGLVAGASSTGWNGIYLGEIARLAGARSVAGITGGALFVTYLGSLSGPLLFGLLVWIRGSETAAFSALGMITLTLVVAWGWSLKRHRP